MSDCLCYSLEFLRGELEFFPMKIDVFFAVNRYQVDMGMRNFEPENDDGDFFTSYISLYFTRDPFGENHHVRQRPVVQVENIVGLLFRDDQRVTFASGLISRNAKYLSSSATL